MPDWLPNPPLPSYSKIHCCEPWSKCILCVFLSCIHSRQDCEAVEDQWKGQASRRLQPEGWRWTDPRPIDHHLAAGKKRSHNAIKSNATQNITFIPINGAMIFTRWCVTFTVWLEGKNACYFIRSQGELKKKCKNVCQNSQYSHYAITVQTDQPYCIIF